MNIPAQIEILPKPKPNWWQNFQKLWQQLAKVVNGNIEFGNPTSGPANIRGVWVSVTTPGPPNTDFTITHNLGRPAVGYWIMQSNGAADIYTSPTPNPNPNTQLILRDTAGSFNLVIFVI
jgi:hypothetical protein